MGGGHVVDGGLENSKCAVMGTTQKTAGSAVGRSHKRALRSADPVKEWIVLMETPLEPIWVRSKQANGKFHEHKNKFKWDKNDTTLLIAPLWLSYLENIVIKKYGSKLKFCRY